LAVLASAVAQPAPTFAEVTVHDPSVVREGGTFYVFGSHLASASSTNLRQWTQISTSPSANNPLVPNPQQEFQEAIAWVGGDNAFWAPDVIRLPDGRFAYYPDFAN
jgi:arabinan endo-1,5-alpha-L-arabinosidase